MRQLDSYNVRQGTLDHLKGRDKEPLERLEKQSEGQKRWLRLNPSIQWEKGDLRGALMMEYTWPERKEHDVLR